MKRLLFFVNQEPIDFIEHETSPLEQPQPGQFRATSTQRIFRFECDRVWSRLYHR